MNKKICDGKILSCFICTAIAISAIGRKVEALLPDPSNAALMYYQAMIVQPEPDEATFWSMEAVCKGADPNERIRDFLNLPESKKVIKLVQLASNVSHCDWGIIYSIGDGSRHFLNISFLPHLNRLSVFLDVYARTLVADGCYQKALEQSIAQRRMAGHIRDGTFSPFLFSYTVDARAIYCIKDILGTMPTDVETLVWLKNQLDIVKETPDRLERLLKLQRDIELQFLRVHPKTSHWVDFPKADEDENLREELLTQAKESYDTYLKSAFKIIDRRDFSYNRKNVELEKLLYEFAQRCSDGEPIRLINQCLHDPIRIYQVTTKHVALINALKVAIEIYLIQAKTGHLPGTLPVGLPKDPFSEKDFEYKIKEESFVLRCRAEEISSHRITQYEFKVNTGSDHLD